MQGAGLVSDHEASQEQPQAREEEDTAPAHCAQRILSRPRVTITELLQQNPNSAGGWATTFRQEVKHEEQTETSMMAGNPQIFTAKSEKNLALSLTRQNLKMDRMKIIQ